MSMRSVRYCVPAGWLCLCIAPVALAADPLSSTPAASQPSPMMMPPPPPFSVAPARVVKPGQVLLNYRYSHQYQGELADGDEDLSPEKVATLPNHNAGQPGQPATYRVVPDTMTVDAHIFAVQVGIVDGLSGVVAVPYLVKENKTITYQGTAGTTKRGTSHNETSGIGDVSASVLYKLYDDPIHHVHLMAGLSFPTGSIREEGRTVAPTGVTREARIAYGMQLGTGTYDLLPGVTYWGARGDWNWGLQGVGRVHLGENDEGYTFGDRALATVWGGYNLGHGFWFSASLSQEYIGDIDGEDDNITGPNPRTDPNAYGGWKTSAGLGLIYRVAEGPLTGINPAIEFSVPLYQDLNGPQLKEAWTVFVGVRKAFTF